MKFRNVIIGYCLCLCAVVLGALSLYENLSPRLAEADKSLLSGRSLLLDAATRPDSLSAILLKGDYFSDPKDAALAARWITEMTRRNGGLENLGQINSTEFKMPVSLAARSGGESFRQRIEDDRINLGQDDVWRAREESLPSTLGNGPIQILVTVTNDEKHPEASLSGIPVRLRKYTYDTIQSKNTKEIDRRIELHTHTLGYAATDSRGEARFNVEPGFSYSVLPIKEGFQYGQEKGTSNELLSKPLKLRFSQKPHVLSPVNGRTFQLIKANGVIIVRTPSEFISQLVAGIVMFAVAWGALLLFMMWRDYMMKVRSDYLLLLLLMALTGVGMVASFAMMDPLTDKSNGYVTATGIVLGVIALSIVSSVNFAKFYNGKSRIQMGFLPFDFISAYIMPALSTNRSVEKRHAFSMSSGFMYLSGALILIFCLAFFGSGPEGSDARVNLGSFQPSELCKYLIIIFIAAFFAENAQLLQEFSKRLTRLTFRRQLSTIAIVLIIILVLMMLYLKVLSDMGPALVLLVTFIFIYSMARRDLSQLFGGMISFILVLVASAYLEIPLLISAGVWLIVWILFWWFKRKRLYESAIFFNMVVIVFLFGAKFLSFFGADSEATRITNRMDMTGSGVWNNTVTGGDQVAQGLWSVASGGLTGLGLGLGDPSLVPACHTDMVFTSIGEMLGLLGLVLVILCFVIVVHRSLLIGQKSANPFVMFLVMGIALVTGVQFLVIVFGSLGLIPLTGVSVPFLSYGRTGLIVTLAAFGVVVSASRIRATEAQRSYAATFSNAVAAGALMFIVGGVVVTGALINYQVVNRDSTLVRPAFITNLMGERVVEYNPRINIILDKLNSGNIFDRNGLLLATTSREELLKARPRLLKAGLTEQQIHQQAEKRRRRYYPFGNQLLFMLGDANTRQVYTAAADNPVGYLAESRHFDLLRGLEIPSSVIEMSSDKFKGNRFVPAVSADFRRSSFDYTGMLDFLYHGTERNPLIETHNARRYKRDIYLTIDAALQMQLQNDLAKYLSQHPLLGKCPNLRASVVVLDANQGDLICSSNYPVPDQDTIVSFQQRRLFSDAPAERLPGHAPVTERDLGLTYQTQPGSTGKVLSAIAGLRRTPKAADTCVYLVYGREAIEGPTEPPYGAPQGHVGMREAIIISSNNYFINLVNRLRLFPELEYVYSSIGARINDLHTPGLTSPPYFFRLGELDSGTPFHNLVNRVGNDSYKAFDKFYMRERKYNSTRRNTFRWNIAETGYAWGQGGLLASPLNMARAASIVANDGQLVPTRYVMRVGNNLRTLEQPVSVISPDAARKLKGFMQEESDKHRAWGRKFPGVAGAVGRMGGKTGTPERGDRFSVNHKSNDAWYVCFIESETLGTTLAIALRLERTVVYDPDGGEDDTNYGSGYATRTMADVVIPALDAAGYKLK